MVPAQTTLAKLADELSTLKSVEDQIEKLANVGGENADEMNAAQTHKALRDLVDLPRIELHDGDDWKDSLSLSTGQKCTTILPIPLLNGCRWRIP